MGGSQCGIQRLPIEGRAEECRFGIAYLRDFDPEPRPKNESVGAITRKFDCEFAAKCVLMDFPDAGNRVRGMHDMAGRMQLRTQLKLMLRRHASQPGRIERPRIGGIVRAMYPPFQAPHIRQIGNFPDRRKIGRKAARRRRIR